MVSGSHSGSENAGSNLMSLHIGFVFRGSCKTAAATFVFMLRGRARGRTEGHGAWSESGLGFRV